MGMINSYSPMGKTVLISIGNGRKKGQRLCKAWTCKYQMNFESTLNRVADQSDYFLSLDSCCNDQGINPDEFLERFGLDWTGKRSEARGCWYPAPFLLQIGPQPPIIQVVVRGWGAPWNTQRQKQSPKRPFWCGIDILRIDHLIKTQGLLCLR